MTIPIAKQSYRSVSKPLSAERLLNLYAEEAPPDAKSSLFLRGTPGARLFAGLGGDSIREALSFGGSLYAVSGSGLYKIAASGATTLLGSVAAAGEVYMAAGGTQVGVLVGATLYVWDGTTLSTVTDADFDGGSSLTYLDGFFIITKPNAETFQISALKDATAYDALDVATAERFGDNLVRGFANNRELVLFGEESTEVWYNSGAADFPFAPIDGGTMEKGLGAARAVAKMDNSVFWLGHDRIIYRLTGFTPERISTHAIEDAIKEPETVSDAWAFAYTHAGHAHFVITFPSVEATFVYDAATKAWHERESYDLGYWRFNCYAYCFGKHLVGDSQSGNIYELTHEVFTEAGQPIIRSATTSPIHENGKRMTLGQLEIDVETGVGLTTGQGSDPQIMIDWSDDGGRTFGNEIWRSLGAIGAYKHRVRIGRMGSFFQRVYRLTVSDPVKTILIGAKR